MDQSIDDAPARETGREASQPKQSAPHRHAYDDGAKPLGPFLTGYRLLVGFYVVGELVLIAQSILLYQEARRFQAGSEPGDALTYFAWAGLALYLLPFLACAYFVCRFTYRANRNLYSVAPKTVTHHPGWAVGSYFLPIANLFVPAQAMSEIYHGTYKMTGEESRANSPISIWWGAWLVSFCASQISGSIGTYTLFTTVLDGLSCLTGIVAALSLLGIMQRIEVRQRSFRHGPLADVFD
ncbi:DUF4328 domain-containing protein [Henriciella litoralis]|uniref:DUF4328 domain-containing protein n=1 Tax=Henriciella litoralis TaxID=568102 RepID=UPI00146E32B6|nr:DUF4328 domain-containing protein [Henriciella litoralis]